MSKKPHSEKTAQENIKEQFISELEDKIAVKTDAMMLELTDKKPTFLIKGDKYDFINEVVKMVISNMLKTFDPMINFKCKCGAMYQWGLRSLPDKNFRCSCGWMIIKYERPAFNNN